MPHITSPLLTLLAAALLLTPASAPAPAAPMTPAAMPAQQEPATSPAAPAVTPAPRTEPAPRPTPQPARPLVFLDPAHGGDDPGAHFPDGSLEKDLTLALASRLHLQLTTFNLAVLNPRESEDTPLAPGATAPATPTPDQRAGIANHAHPFACIVLHATSTGTGVHVITASLPPAPEPQPTPDGIPPTHVPLTPWLSAQAASLPQSDRLAESISTSLSRAGLPVHRFRAPIRPLVSLTCPAVLIEVAPLTHAQSPADSAYQGRIAQSIATALLFFRSQSESPAPPAGATAQP